MEKQAWIQDPKTANTARFHWDPKSWSAGKCALTPPKGLAQLAEKPTGINQNYRPKKQRPSR